MSILIYVVIPFVHDVIVVQSVLGTKTTLALLLNVKRDNMSPIPESLHTELLNVLRRCDHPHLDRVSRNKWLSHAADGFLDSMGIVGVNPNSVVKLYTTLKENHDKSEISKLA